MSALDAAIAVTRFGLGARPDEIDQAEPDPTRYLRRQIQPSGGPLLDGAPSSREAWLAVQAYREEIQRVQREGGENPEAELAEARRTFFRLPLTHLARRTGLAVMTPNGFAERWVRFWSNHFSVSSDGLDMVALAPTLEAEAIRPNAFGRFDALALAADLHPAMLVYLDNHISVGPTSPLGTRAGRGLNENLAREILELHTLGAQGGYSQADVEAFARALTGWTVGNRRLHREAQWGYAMFDARLHERGSWTVLNRPYRDSGAEQARAIITDLANSPITAARLSEKLARHFFSDTPSPAQISHIERAWTRSGGDLARVAEAVITAPDAFNPAFAKFKQPEEFMIGALRALGASPPRPRDLREAFTAIGQRPFSAPSPEGWPDDEPSWADPDAIKKRLEFSNALARRSARGETPLMRAEAVLGERLDADTALSVSRAESEVQGLTLMLMSPDFLRR